MYIIVLSTDDHHSQKIAYNIVQELVDTQRYIVDQWI